MKSTIFSKLQNKYYNEIVLAFRNTDYITLNREDYLRLQDVLDILTERGYLVNIESDNEIVYYKEGNFSDFDRWQKDIAREKRRLSRREWYIAVISAIIGALIGLIPSVLTWIEGLLK